MLAVDELALRVGGRTAEGAVTVRPPPPIQALGR
jgi:hypothetical protein